MGRNMKDSGIEWIGEIPEDWEISKIKYGVEKVGSGKTPRGGAETYPEQGILFLRSQNIYDTGINLDSPTYISEETDEEMKNTRVYPNDVLLNITGGSIGRCCIFPQELKQANVNQHVSIIRVNKDVFTPEYVHYFWICSLGKNAIDLYQTGGNREGMSADAIKNTFIPYIPVAKQREITNYLDRVCRSIDTSIEKTKETIETYKSLKQSLITRAVTKGIRGEREMKDSGIEWIGGIPKDWKFAQLGRFVTISSGISVGRVYSQGTELVEVPYLRVANVQGEYVDLSDVATIKVTREEAEKYKLRAGSLLMTEGGDRDKLGRGTLWKGEIENCIHQNHVFEVRPNDALLVRFLDYITTSDVARIYFDITAKKTTNLACTNKTTILKFKLPVPEVSEQQEIVDYLDEKCSAIDTLIAKKEQLLSELETYKKSLIYEYVTGKREVPA